MKTVLELENLANKAVKAALNQQWDAALALNQEILADSPDDVEATNRLARAHQELGDISEATSAYQKVLALDPFNTIAQKNFEKLKSGAGSSSQRKVSSELFLEEPGKTRSVAILRPKHAAVSKYSSGEELVLKEKNGVLALLSSQGEQLGVLSEELSNHLLKLTGMGNEYSAHLMTTSTEPTVFLRETKQDSAAAKYVSFGRVANGTSSGSLSTPRSLRRASASEEDASPDEDLEDAWESDDDSDMDNDDELAVSLEQMQDEEERAYGSKGSDY